ncbi:hypothetical protein DBR36_06050 [Microbacterium sp. HMWF026]|nr:hypothetical protein DBR36_06050 [Microbacterium sp. HMWF026]
MRRVPTTRKITRTAVARNWTRLMRVISKGAPKMYSPGKVMTASGKNSEMEGGWNSAPADAKFVIRVAA